MSVDDGNLERERPFINPELLEAPLQRLHTIESGVEKLNDVVRIMLDAQEAA